MQNNKKNGRAGTAKGYPEKYSKGMEVKGVPTADAIKNVKVYQAGTALNKNKTVTTSERV